MMKTRSIKYWEGSVTSSGLSINCRSVNTIKDLLYLLYQKRSILGI